MSSRCLQFVTLLGLLALAGCSSPLSSSSSAPSPAQTPSPTALGLVPSASPGAYLATDDGSLVALNLSDGSQRWKQENVTANSLVALDHHVLYVSLGQTVTAFNASNGVQRWQAMLDDVVSTDSGAFLIADGVVYVGTEQYLYALNASDGTRRWKSPQPVGPVFALALSGNTLYVDNGSILALSANDGTRLWYFIPSIPAPAPGRYLSAMALANGIICTGEAGRTDGPAYIFAVDASTGKERWHSQPGRSSPSPQPVGVVGLIVDNGTLYVSEKDDTTSLLYALESTTGNALWHFSLPQGAKYLTAPVTANGIVYIGATEQSGVVFAVDAQTGKQRWSILASGSAARSALATMPRAVRPARPLSGGPLVFTPFIQSGMLYIRAENQIYALTADTGAKQWAAQPGAANNTEWVVG